MALERPISRCPTIAPPGSYQKIERKVGDFATAAAAVQMSLNADGTIAGGRHRAVGALGPTALRVDAAEQLLAGAEADEELIRAAMRDAA